jgi:protein arginine kinase activator
MECQICKKNPAKVHITEVNDLPTDNGADGKPILFTEKHLCEPCATRHQIPFTPVSGNKPEAVWNLLLESARRARAESGLSCPDCGMTLAEFRSKGRLGCPNDYELFKQHVDPLLLRMHNSTQHRGRGAGPAGKHRERLEALNGLQEKLQVAIEDEAYESAARLRDEISKLESPG